MLINLLRFTGDVDRRLVRAARANRSLDGSFTVDRVEYVLTDKFLSTEATETLAKIRLGTPTP